MTAYLKLERQKFTVFLLFCLFSSGVYVTYIYLPYNLPRKHLFSKTIMSIKDSKSESSHLHYKSAKSLVEIVFWISPQNPPSQNRQGLMKEMVEKMNSDFDNSCDDGSESLHGRKKPSENYNCRFSMKSENISDADAVVFFMFINGYKISELPSISKRNPNQLWMMFALEPPVLSGWVDPLHNIFNWTMTNRMDSDVWWPYGKAIKSHSSKQTITIGNTPLDKFIAGKSKLVVGVISNCHTQSRRETLISKMNKTGIGYVDIFGQCGQSQICDRSEYDCSKFWNKIGQEYKFFLAFENSLCKDYITEKFWRALTLGMVPVVYGAGQYKIEAPPQSYINVNDFSTVEKLMTYLTILDKDDKQYSKYFEWRATHKISMERRGWSTYGFCNLCKAVSDRNRNAGNANRKYYEDLKWWFNHQPNSNKSICANPPSKFI